MKQALSTLMARKDRNGAFGVADERIESYLIERGLCRYTQRPLMLVTERGRQEIARHRQQLRRAS
ncbi:hypothetical protein [Rhizobium sp. Root1220]|uniref:hypothetical protein n=1 Tax=Rhizobium sp. Root1220 TaxID=1736432 RepID=UPI000701F730|nr:hypothetical protein [Rhizobium sp. Root1220]KQV83281.1 hypothetical protein ASC90_22080 [Rhizobium sp. Root1220]